MPMSHNAWRSFFSKPRETTVNGVRRLSRSDFHNEWDLIVNAAREYYPECVIEVRFTQEDGYLSKRWGLRVLKVYDP